MSNLKPINQPAIVKSKSASANLSPEVVMAAGKGIELISEIITSIRDYSIAKEHEKTERERIQAFLELGLKRVENERKNFIDVLKIKHEERMTLYTALQGGIQRAIEKGDHEMVRSLLQFTKEIYSDNPELSLGKGKRL